VIACGNTQLKVIGGTLLTSHPTPFGQSRVERQVITIEELAARLDKALYSTDLSPAAVEQECRKGLGQGVAAVLVRPDQLEVASAAVQGRGVAVVTALSWYEGDTVRMDGDAMRAEAESLVAGGATEVAYVVTQARLEHDAGREVVDQVRRLVETVAPMGARVRALIATEELSDEDIRRTCREVAAAGVWMVQGGSWRGRRTSLTQVEAIRASVPPHVLVKWTEPIRSLSTLLLCLSMGVDRFNCDVEQILDEAKRADWLASLTIPVAGVDY
jgi:deoxyribose-phosphate aldolase